VCWRILVIMGAVIAAAWVQPVAVRAQEKPSFPCRWLNGAFRNANLFPRVEPNNRRVVLVDYRTGAVITELAGYVDGLMLMRDSGVRLRRFESGWSPDCRFLLALRPTTDGYYDLIVWDIANGGTVHHVIAGVPIRSDYRPLVWDRSARYAVLRAERSTWLVDVHNRTQTNVSDNHCGLLDFYVDSGSRHAIIVKQVTFRNPPTFCAGADRAITVVDLNTGAEVRRIETPQVVRGPYFDVSPDGRLLAVKEFAGSFERYASVLLVVEWRTGAVTQLNNGPGSTGVLSFSPDSRYLVIGGQHYVRVWDLQQLAGTVAERKPQYYRMPRRYMPYRFISNTVIQLGTVDAPEGQIDLSTGQAVYVNSRP
jgi:WD40 repeat protein